MTNNGAVDLVNAQSGNIGSDRTSEKQKTQDQEPVRVLIIAENPLARLGLAALLTGQPGITVVGQTGSGGDLLTEISALHADVLLWDLDWNAAVERLSVLNEDSPPVLALLPSRGDAADAWAAGARGLLLHNADADEIATALVGVARGLAVFDPGLAAAVFPAPVPAPQEDLTPREREVLQLVAEGLPNKLIASRLKISEHTVKFHVNAILSKLNVASRTEAVVRAARLGLILL
jgi:two-component system, NarL family, nitrate/nitrite response regulator NarL